MSAIDMDRISVANEVLGLILPKCNLSFSVSKGYLMLSWHGSWQERKTTKRWMCGRNFYPPYTLPTGGTHTVAIANLAAWIRGKKCYPLTTWSHWVSDAVKMTPPRIVEILREGGYSAEANCGFCGEPIERGWDWYYAVGVGCLASIDCAKHPARKQPPSY